MNLIEKISIKAFFYAFISFIYYTIFCVVLFILMFYAFSTKKIFTEWPLDKLQKSYYMEGFQNIWQNSSCAVSDNALIYKPAIGECLFENLEFSTKLNFDDEGRHVPARGKLTNQNVKSIIVLGDSFAMGWGVNDSDTFANFLQEKIKRPIYNLGVSSYGTYREINRLIKSTLLNSSDTIIIQYCDNDLEENLKMSQPYYDRQKSIEKAKLIIDKSKKNSFFKNLKILVHTIYRAPKAFLFKKISSSGGNFNDHVKVFKKIIGTYNAELKNKKIIVFYTNSHGIKFENFPNGQDKDFKNLFFYDLNLQSTLFYKVDGHLTVNGHHEVANKLLKLIK